MSRATRLLARVCVATALGREPSVRASIRAALKGGVAAGDVREAVLQTHLFAGFPRAINALWELAEQAGPAGKRAPDGRGGEALCRRVYGRDYGAVIANMRRLSGELADWIVAYGYGTVLSRPGLDARTRELLVVPTLAALRTWRQLAGHLRGALAVGAGRREVREVMRAVADLVGAAAVKRVDAMLEGS